MKDQTEKRTAVLKGIGVSPGVAIGKAYVIGRITDVPCYKLQDAGLVKAEIRRFRKAVKESRRQLQEIKEKLVEYEGVDSLYIIDVHLMILRDKRLGDETIRYIKDKCINAEWALKKTVDRYRHIFNMMEDDYLGERISDIEYVEQRILRNLVEKKRETLSDIGEDIIIISRDISPPDTFHMKVERILGFATDVGGKTSHTAIVARSIDIPAVAGLESITREVRTDDEIIIDGDAGLVIVNPDPETIKRYENKKRYCEVVEESLLRWAHLPAITKDNYKVAIGANIGFTEEIPSAIAHGAEGVGLYRTEFMYIYGERLPTEEEHFSNYKSVTGNKSIEWSTIRTFDLGGDKFASNPESFVEMNPQLGFRAIRFCLKEIELFKVQLRAILRASVFGRTRVLFPMISGVGELRAVRKVLEEVKSDLLRKNIPVGEDLELGIMMEVPSAVMVADELAKEVDFFSIGTNDLIQYALAIDRINERVSYLYEPLHPAVLRLIKHIVDAGHKEGIRVAMCGEMAGEPAYTPILLGLGLDEFSITSMAIPHVKKIIRNSTMRASKELLERVMTFPTAEESEKFIRSYMRRHFPEDFPEDEQWLKEQGADDRKSIAGKL